MVETLAFVASGFLAGAVLCWVAMSGQRKSLADARQLIARQEEQLQQAGREMQEQVRARAVAEAVAARVPQLEDELRAARVESEQRLALFRELEGKAAERAQAAEEGRQERERSQQSLLESFQALSARALQANNDSFLQLASQSMEKFQEGAKGDLEARGKAVEALVLPIRESLTRVDSKIGEIERERQSAYAALNEQVRGLVQEHIPLLRSETAGLVKALRQPAARGRWGEIQLRRVVEMAGMLNHCDFMEQRSEETADGVLRPDLVVRLPGGKQIVVDAKVPLAAHLEASEAQEDSVRDAHLVRHVQQVRAHMTALGRKAYWEAFEPTPEFVVMFLPGEAFFSAALQQDPALIEFGVNEKVIPATPTTLIALLRAVAYGWRQEALALNAAEIANLGKDLHGRLATLGEHWQKVGQRLGKAVEAYNQSVGALEGRVLSSARKFRDLRAVATEEEIETVVQIEQQVRVLTAEELAAPAPRSEG
jgi:DNA recombination protein RmuC